MGWVIIADLQSLTASITLKIFPSICTVERNKIGFFLNTPQIKNSQLGKNVLIKPSLFKFIHQIGQTTLAHNGFADLLRTLHGLLGARGPPIEKPCFRLCNKVHSGWLQIHYASLLTSMKYLSLNLNEVSLKKSCGQ